MSKTWLIIQREYLTRVKKKSFLLTTILVPIIIIGFYAAIIALAVSGGGENEKIAIIDEANLFEGRIPPDKEGKESVSYTLISNEEKSSFQKDYHDKGYSAYLYIPKIDIKDPKGIELHSQATVSMSVKGRIENKLDKAIETKRLLSENIDPKKYESIKSDVDVISTIDSEEGGKRSVEGVAYAVAFAAGILIYMILLIYGSMVMRGVMEEKTNRISEVIISSVKPMQLMLGKIIGIGAVGITQFLIWIILIGVLQLLLPMIFPGMAGQMTEQIGANGMPTGKENMLATISQGLRFNPDGFIIICIPLLFPGRLFDVCFPVCRYRKCKRRPTGCAAIDFPCNDANYTWICNSHTCNPGA